jgi:hypothetical protein
MKFAIAVVCQSAPITTKTSNRGKPISKNNARTPPVGILFILPLVTDYLSLRTRGLRNPFRKACAVFSLSLCDLIGFLCLMPNRTLEAGSLSKFGAETVAPSSQSTRMLLGLLYCEPSYHSSNRISAGPMTTLI